VPRARPSVAPLAGVALLLSACHARPDHPVLSTALAPSPPVEAAADAPEPPPPSGAAARAALFAGMPEIDAALRALAARPSPPGAPPRIVELPALEREVLRTRGGAAALGPIRLVTAFGSSGRAPLPPSRMADLALDPEAERFALAADAVREIGREIDLPGVSRRRFWTEMRQRAYGPFRTDFRFASTAERWDLPDGTVLLRQDSWPVRERRGVTLYRGGAVLEPDGAGSRVTEVTVVGVDVAVPFFLVGAARRDSLGVSQNRLIALWTRAQWRLEGRDPLEARRPLPRAGPADGR